MSKKIGILGGSFDPIHQGHLNIAESARVEFALDEVWFVPAGHSPNKNESDMTPANMRAKMTELAILGYPHFKLSRIEVDSSETNYTYLTLTKLAKQYKDVQFYFIMGADSLDYFEQWRHPEIICEKATLLVAVRDDMDIAQIEHKILELKKLFRAEIYPIKSGRTDISSTLREQLKSSDKHPSLSPGQVWEYVCANDLYDVKANTEQITDGNK